MIARIPKLRSRQKSCGRNSKRKSSQCRLLDYGEEHHSQVRYIFLYSEREISDLPDRTKYLVKRLGYPCCAFCSQLYNLWLVFY